MIPRRFDAQLMTVSRQTPELFPANLVLDINLTGTSHKANRNSCTMFVRIPWASIPRSQRHNVPWECEKPNATELHSLPHCLAKPERPRAEGHPSLRLGSARLYDCRKAQGACRGRLS